MRIPLLTLLLFTSIVIKGQNIYISNYLTFCSGQTQSVYFSINVQPPNNTFDLYLSNSNGSFATDSTYLGNFNTGGDSYYYASITIPAGLVSSSNYKLVAKTGGVIISNTPSVTYINSSSQLSASISGNYTFSECNNYVSIPINYVGNGSANLYYTYTAGSYTYNTSMSLYPGSNSISFYANASGSITLTQIQDNCKTQNLNSTATFTQAASSVSIDSLSLKSICLDDNFLVYNTLGGCTYGSYYMISLSTGNLYSLNTNIGVPYSSCSISNYNNSLNNISAEEYFKIVYYKNGTILAESTDSVQINANPSISPNNYYTNSDNQKIVKFSINGELPVVFEINEDAYTSYQNTFEYALNSYTFYYSFGNITDSKGCNNSSITSSSIVANSYVPNLQVTKVNSKPISSNNYDEIYNRTVIRGHEIEIDFDYNWYYNLGAVDFDVLYFKKYDSYYKGALESNFDLELKKAKIKIPEDMPVGNYTLKIYPKGGLYNSNNNSEFNIRIIESTPIMIDKITKVYSPNSNFNLSLRTESLPNLLRNAYANYIVFKNLADNQKTSIYLSSYNSSLSGINVDISNVTTNSIYELESLVIDSDTIPIGNKYFYLYPNLAGTSSINLGYSIGDYYNAGGKCIGSEVTVPIYPTNSNNGLKLQFFDSYNDRIITSVKTLPVGNNQVKFIMPDLGRGTESKKVVVVDTVNNLIGYPGNNYIHSQRRVKIISNYMADVFPGQNLTIPLKEGLDNPSYSPATVSLGQWGSSIYLNYNESLNYLIFQVPNNSSGTYNLSASLNSPTCGYSDSLFKAKINLKSVNNFTVQKSVSQTYCNSNSIEFEIVGTNNHVEGDSFKVFRSSIEYLGLYKDGKIIVDFPTDENGSIVFYSLRNKNFSNNLSYSVNSNQNFSASLIGNNYSNPSPTNLNISYSNSNSYPNPATLQVLEAYQTNSHSVPTNADYNKQFYLDQSASFKIMKSKDFDCPYKNFSSNSSSFRVSVAKTYKAVKINKLLKSDLCGADKLSCLFDKEIGASAYTLQIREIGADTYSDITTTNSPSTTLNGTLPSTINLDRYYTFRIKYTKNGQTLYSNPSPIPFMKRSTPTVTISGGGTITKDLSIKNKIYFDFTGRPPFNCTYTDGTTNYSFTATENHQVVLVDILKNTTFSIVSLNNGCSGTFSGSAAFIVNGIDALPIGAIGTKCSNQTISIPYNILGNIPNNSSNLKIKLFNYGSNGLNSSNSIELPGTISGNTLSAPVTTALNNFLVDGSTYYAKIVSNSPKVESNYVKLIGTNDFNTFKYYGNKPSYTLTGQTTIVNGESTNLVFDVSGYSEFWSFKLNNGITDTYYYPTSFPFTIPVSPTSTTTYKITELNCSCGNIAGSPVPITITVGNCQSFLNITSVLTSGSEFHIANKIDATSKINQSASMELNGGKEIVLKPGFEAKKGSNFKAIINGCNN